MRLYLKNKLILEVCGDDTAKGVILNIFYGLKYFLMDFRKPHLWLAHYGRNAK